jgi:GAF domain-containing protein
MTSKIAVGGNLLLDALVRTAPGPWQNEMEQIDLPLGKVLHEPYMPRSHIFFPVTAIVSLLYVLADGNMAETAVVGHEGVIGLSMFTGDGKTPSCAIVQCAGTAIRINAAFLKDEFVRAGQVANVLLLFTQALVTQMAQTAVCNRYHAIEQHLCRWILLMLDSHACNEIALTQEMISAMLGVRRAGINMAAGQLQRGGVMSYTRGKMVVHDRPAMESRACECYGVIKGAYDRLLPGLQKIATPTPPWSLRTDLDRLAFLHSLGILDSLPEPTFDDIALQASRRLDVPIAVISLMDKDRDWFKAYVGFSTNETLAQTSFCDAFFRTGEHTLVVENTLKDRRFSAHTLVQGMPFIRFYAAVRLVADGHALGTLCVYDSRERRLRTEQIQVLQSLAQSTVDAIAARGSRVLIE